MRVCFTILLLLLTTVQGCNSSKYITVKHVKPVNRSRYFIRKKDKRKKRVKYVKVKILKKPSESKSKPTKKEKEQHVKSDSLIHDKSDEITEPLNENDSTGF